MKRVAGRLAWGAVTIAVVAVWFVLLRPASLGGETTWIVIRGSSMLPVYETGDLVIVRRAASYAVGDIVAYRVPAGDIGEGQVVIHRIIGGDTASGFLIQGDNNENVDPWLPRQDDMVGTAWVAMPGLGRVIAWLHDPIVLAGIMTAIVISYIVGRPSGPRAAPMEVPVRRSPAIRLRRLAHPSR